MAKNFNNQEILNFLERIDFLIGEGYGPGLPIYLKKGKFIINKFINLFIQTIKNNNFKYKNIKTYQITSLEEFKKCYRGINDHTDEIIYFEDKMISSDPLIQTLSQARQKYINIITVSSIYREKSRGLIPLFKDKYIYPVIQIDQRIPIERCLNNIELLQRIYKRFYRKNGGIQKHFTIST